MSVISLNAARREALGKGGARKARAKGHIPGVLYGHGEQPVALSLEGRAFQVAMKQHKGNAIVSLAVDGTEHTALVRAVQYDPVGHVILHLDFQRISLTEEVEVRVALHLVGTAVGVKDEGGILEAIMREVLVRCLPTAIPAAIDVDVTGLAIGGSVHVRDLKVPNVVILSDPDATITTVVPPTVMEEKVVDPSAPVAAEPEVVGTKGKKDEEGAEGKEKEKK